MELSKIEIASLRQQLSILEERTRNLNILADDVHGTTPEEVEAAREQMQNERAKRLKAIQLEIGGDEVRYLPNVLGNTSVCLYL